MVKKRERPSWNESFMFRALWAATRSSCLYLHTGAVVVKNNREIASGYNGALSEVENCLERGCRKDAEGVPFERKGQGVCRGMHAEVNALIEALKTGFNLEGNDIYTLYLPCSGCAKMIAQCGIGRVFYTEVYGKEEKLTKETFKEKKIELIPLDLDVERCYRMIKHLNDVKKRQG